TDEGAQCDRNRIWRSVSDCCDVGAGSIRAAVRHSNAFSKRNHNHWVAARTAFQELSARDVGRTERGLLENQFARGVDENVLPAQTQKGEAPSESHTRPYVGDGEPRCGVEAGPTPSIQYS